MTKGKLKTDLREKDEKEKERQARRGLDSRDNCGSNTITFFFQNSARKL